MKRVGVPIACTALALVAIGGAAHLPFAAPLVRRFLPGSICPVTRGTPAQIDRATAIAAAAIRREASPADAPERLALGFALDVTTVADVDAWAARHGITCTNIAGNATLRRCRDVPAEAVGHPASFGRLEEVTFEFRATGALVIVATTRRGLTPERAATISASIAATHRDHLGAPSKEAGEPRAEYLGRSVLATYVAEHAFANYRATVAATNLARTGVMVREQYLALDAPPR